MRVQSYYIANPTSSKCVCLLDLFRILKRSRPVNRIFPLPKNALILKSFLGTLLAIAAPTMGSLFRGYANNNCWFERINEKPWARTDKAPFEEFKGSSAAGGEGICGKTNDQPIQGRAVSYLIRRSFPAVYFTFQKLFQFFKVGIGEYGDKRSYLFYRFVPPAKVQQ